MFIIDIKYIADMATIDAHLAEHRAYLDIFYAKGLLLCSGPKNPRDGGIIIGMFNTREEVESFIHDDPYSKYGIASYQITAFAPVKHHKLLSTVLNI